jgi:uncharacterized protein (DUF58 family)
MRLRPARRLLVWLLVPLLGLICMGIGKAMGWIAPTTMDSAAWGALAVLLLAAVVDAIGLTRLPTPVISRRVPASLALGRWGEVELTLVQTGRRPLHISVFDHVPADLRFEGLPRAVTLPAGHSTRLTYRICPQQRGPQPFSHCEVAILSPLGLWRQARTLPLADQPRVYPDFAGLQGDRLSAVDSWLNQLGVRQQPRRGQGMEFNQLRELRDGDSQRQIDWKATARHSRPIVREYQDERDQQIIFLLDCGRRMRSQDDSLSHFDHALNACLLLSRVALRQGDAVGLLTFAGESLRFVPPQKGQRQLNILLDAVHDLETSRHQADFSEAARQLLQRQRRRALVVLVSNLGDEDDEQLLTAVKQIGRYHRVLVASLREGVLDKIREAPLHTWQQALDYCGTVEYLHTRDTLNDRLKAHGVALMDARPAELGAGLISRYLNWKKAGLL